MALPQVSHRRLLLPLVLALMLAGAAAGLAVATRGAPSGPGESLSASPIGVHAGWSRSALGAAAERAERTTPPPERSADEGATLGQEHVRPSLGRGATVRPELTTAAQATTVIAPKPVLASSYRGRNHVWIPSLGINRSVSAFPCSRSRPPDNLLYRWGCSGRNNVYLMGHAHSVFKPLHDAYAEGRLKKGMQVVYADSSGRVRTYSVIWWKVVRPTTEAAWAWAGQSTPSMTLQTCVGPNGDLRLMVRLVATS
jgi:hypothetical protein